MDLVTVRELYRNSSKYVDQKVKIGGWVRNLRDSKTFGFLVINDGTYFQTLHGFRRPLSRASSRIGRK